ncbi:MAG: hypothetical protein JW875_07945 [Spirochaetales bacterium]|nr:hypothetical protein [Spirochaetales bacterium]
MRSHDYYRNIIHPVIALVLPASFLVSCTLLVTALLVDSLNLPEGLLPNWHGTLILLSMISGLTAVVCGNIFQREHVRWTARLRELIVLAMFVYALASLSKDGPLSSRGIPSLSNIFAVLYASFQWFVSARIQNALRDREILALELEGKNGDELYSSMRDAGAQPAAAQQSLEWLKGFSTSFAIVLLVLLLLSGSKNITMTVLTILSVMQYFWVYLFILILCSQYGFEQYAAGAGLRETDRQRSGRLRFAVIIILLIGGSAFLFGGYSSLIPTTWIGALFIRLGLWIRSFIPGAVIRLNMQSQLDDPAGKGFRELIPYGDHGTDLSAFFESLARFAPIAFGIFVVLFLLSPLVSKRYRVMIARHSVISFLREVFAHFRTIIGTRDGSEEKRAPLDPDNLREVRTRLAGMGRLHTDRKRRNEFGRVCRLFLRLISWGKRQGVIFTAVTAARTYTSTLSQRFPAYKETFAVIADCFEQAVYSSLPLGKERLADYEKAIKSVVKFK